ncbi:hypothetical protein AGABI2DRAFT_211731 [Agaricus bisporus var. bisporus H97]|uniref:hypothetical protein n=1 Tax=Agaricus bisporus var. bisporus (strain H97 / ATCC MYA-4626 / FGSC 10389) TaxID=936046 RepID=UPI00029F6753|nr:hypothetical protein AGABI2DRAFT_211731 [Agaricus bisporus var. bisporus H97]EKV42348.1 hypothetical protein AGABI2DRAFT_211731 [Agaricus bisporus var. bisporus H97]
MAPGAAINDPFLLSTYSVTKRTSQLSSVYASYQKPSSSSDGFVSVAVQSDGVHVLDVTTLHPIISRTLGPSTTFACAPLTQHKSSKNIHTTYAAIASSPDIESENKGRTLWKWTENLSGPLTDHSSSSKNQRETMVVSHLVSGLYDCEELPDRILAISPAGDMTLLTTGLELKTSHPASTEDNRVISVHIFSQSSSSFLKLNSEGAVVVLLVEYGDSIQVEVYSIDTDDAITSVVLHKVSITNKDIATASCSSSGILNIISHTGHWNTFSISLSALVPLSSPIQLKGLSFINSPPPSPLEKGQSQIKAEKSPSVPSLLALTSSHALLASSTPQGDIALLLWDTQYSILLASHLLPIPSSLSPQSSSLDATLLSPSAAGITAGSQQAILSISQPMSDANGKISRKTNVYVVPYSIPARSTLANVIGRSNDGARWLASHESMTKDIHESPAEAAKSKLISGIRIAVEQNRPEAANELFTQWEKEQEKDVELNMSFQEEFGYEFVKDILDAVIQPQKPPNSLYSSEIVRRLIQKGVVRSAMVAAGLLVSLRMRNDWVFRISSIVVGNHSLTSNSTDPNAMQVDSANPSQLPNLRGFLATLLQHRKFTTTQLMLAVRRYLRSSEAITLLIQVLDEWIKKLQAQEAKLLPSKKDIGKNEFGVLVVKEGTEKQKTVSNLPSMDQVNTHLSGRKMRLTRISKILNFLQPVLDASFLVLLQHRPAHEVLRSLKVHIDPEIVALSQTEQLRGLVEGFAKAHEKAIKDAETGKGKNGKASENEGSTRDWRHRRKEAHEQVAMAIGVYQLEELTFCGLGSFPRTASLPMSDFRVAVLTVSDTAFKDASADKSGPAIIDILHAHKGFKLASDTTGSTDPFYKIVPDNLDHIRTAVKTWVDQDGGGGGEQSGVDWVITTGGTGFGVRDVTPEAIKLLLDREAPGLVHLLLSASLQHTPLGALSRPVAGTCKNTLIITLPGSPKAVKETLAALFNQGLINHALELVRGGTGENRHILLSVSARHRKSPYELVSFEDAIRLIKDNIQPLETQALPVDAGLRNHVLAEDIFAPNNTPPRATTSVDGYALRSTDPPAVYQVVSSRNHPIDQPLPSGIIYRINTGGPLPVGTDTVIMVEDTKLVSSFEATDNELEGEENEVETLVTVPRGENVRSPGSDVRKGDLVLQKGERILSNGGEIGTLAFVGRRETLVYKKPIVAILSTGNEIVDLQAHTTTQEAEWGGIFDTNRPSLRAALEGLGYSVIDLGIVPDKVDDHVAAIQKGIDSADILITTGGTSMGPTDLFKPVIERHFNGTIHFGRVTIKPGKPTTFATIPVAGGVAKPLFALPGNPASALVTFHIFVLPALRKLAGWPSNMLELPMVSAELQSPMSLDPRTEFHRAVLRIEKGGLKAYSTGGQRSSRVASLAGANGFVIVPPGSNAVRQLEVGAKVDVMVIGEIQSVL